MRSALLLLLACGGVVVFPYPVAHAQELQWERTFGGTDGDFAQSVRQTTDGGYILAGSTRSSGAGGADVWLVKTDPSGNRLWDQTFGGPDFDRASSVQQTTDRGYILAGITESYGAGEVDVWLIKTDASGSRLWDHTFGAAGRDFARCVQQTSDEGYILAGETDSYGSGQQDAWLIKTDASGNKLWDHTFGGRSFDAASCVQQTSEGGFILAGVTRSYDAVDWDALLIKTDPDGNKIWDQTFGGADDEWAFWVQQTTDGGYILAGFTESYGAEVMEGWLVNTDADGNRLWDQTFGAAGSGSASSVQQTRDGGYVLVGSTSTGAEGPPKHIWLIKTDAVGNKMWAQSFGGPRDDGATCVQQTSDGGYVVAGSTRSYGAGGWDAWLIKIAPEPTAVEAETASELLPSGFALRQNVPNPFNPTTTILYGLPERARVSLDIYSLTGQQVAGLASGYQARGAHRAVWDARGIGSGVYLYHLEAGPFRETKRMVLVR